MTKAPNHLISYSRGGDSGLSSIYWIIFEIFKYTIPSMSVPQRQSNVSYRLYVWETHFSSIVYNKLAPCFNCILIKYNSNEDKYNFTFENGPRRQKIPSSVKRTIDEIYLIILTYRLLWLAQVFHKHKSLPMKFRDENFYIMPSFSLLMESLSNNIFNRRIPYWIILIS